MNKIEKQSVDRYAMDYAALSAQLAEAQQGEKTARGLMRKAFDANVSLSTQITAATKRAESAHATGKAEGLRAAESYVCSALDALTSGAFDASDPRIEALAEYAEKLRALTPADTPAAKVALATCCWCGGSGMVLDSFGEPDRCHKCPTDTPAAKVKAQEALMVEQIDAVSAACRTFKLSEPSFRAALRAIAGDKT